MLEAEDSLLLRSGSVVTATIGELILRSGLDSTDNTGGMTLDGTLRALAPGQAITLDLNDEQGRRPRMPQPEPFRRPTCGFAATPLPPPPSRCWPLLVTMWM
ncbi:MAG UNVERIFIED_CONTAM: hypothetical protein LVR18_49905 [Planctomycetaceae bacterium]